MRVPGDELLSEAISTLDQFSRVVLSPHLDDGPLSCGGSIHRWTSGSESVLVISFMTGDPPGGPVSPFAAYQHRRWGVSAGEAFATRRAEDAEASEVLGARHIHLGLPDCIYRGDESGAFYTSDEGLFGVVHPADELLVPQLVQRLQDLGDLGPAATVYAPLGLGSHVDHQLVRRAAEVWAAPQLCYYEDFPYAAANSVGAWEPPMESHLSPLAQGDMEAKLEAIRCYGSQIEILFGSQAEMQARVLAFGRGLGPGAGAEWAERFWRLGAL